MNEHEKINYVEFPSADLERTKRFFGDAFGWDFEDFGPDYCAFAERGLDGGFYRADLYSTTINGAALVVFYSEKLDKMPELIVRLGGQISKPIFSFPGGRRFHFSDPGGSEFAMWSDK